MPLCIKPLRKTSTRCCAHFATLRWPACTSAHQHSSAHIHLLHPACCACALARPPPAPHPCPWPLSSMYSMPRVCQHNAHHLRVYTPTHAAYASQPVPCWSTPVCASYHASIGNLVIVYLVFGGDKGPGEADVRGGLGAPAAVLRIRQPRAADGCECGDRARPSRSRDCGMGLSHHVRGRHGQQHQAFCSLAGAVGGRGSSWLGGVPGGACPLGGWQPAQAEWPRP